jgi:hypothetical protein
MNSHVGSWSLEWTPKSSKRHCRDQNPSHGGVLYIIRKLSKCKCRNWARMSHLDICSTSYDKKKRSGVKLPIQLWTTKSYESTQFPCIQATCDISLKNFQRGIQLCFKSHCDLRSPQDVMCPQSCGSPDCGNFEIPTCESQDKKPFGCGPHGEL